MKQSQTESTLRALAADRVLLLDGSMGTMLQQHRFDEAEFRNTRFKDWKRDVRGNNDLLSLTQPDAVREIHLAYYQAGADIVSTNTFSYSDRAGGLRHGGTCPRVEP